MKVIFLGTGDFSRTVLEAIYASRHTVVGIVSQPDKVNGRNGKVIPSPVKLFASEHDIPLYQYEKISRDGVSDLRALGADIMVTSAYGQMLSEEVLEICPHGVINTHASLLPKYRGASPIQMALLNGDGEIGTTIMHTVYAMDAGDIILSRSIPLNGDENAEYCFEALAALSATACVEALDAIEDGTAVSVPQDGSQATFCKKLTKQDGKLDFTLTATELHNRVRAFYGFPSTYCSTPFGTLKVIKSEVTTSDVHGAPGEVVENKKERFVVACGGNTYLAFVTVQGEGGKAMSVGQYNLGHRIAVGTVLE